MVIIFNIIDFTKLDNFLHTNVLLCVVSIATFRLPSQSCWESTFSRQALCNPKHNTRLRNAQIGYSVVFEEVFLNLFLLLLFSSRLTKGDTSTLL